MDGTTGRALAARDGDREALCDLIDATYGIVWRYIVATIGRPDAEDLTQETFERALRSLPRFRGDSTATTWLIGIARHVCLDHLRKVARRHREPALVSDVPGGHEPDPAGWVELHDLVRRLEPERRDAFFLTQALGFSYEQAGAICQCPVGTIRSRVARARSDLMAMVDHLASQPAARPWPPRERRAGG